MNTTAELEKPYTREQWLGYRVVDALLKSQLDIRESPATEVWSVVDSEIEAWMNEHEIPTGKPPGRNDNEITEALRRLVKAETAWNNYPMSRWGESAKPLFLELRAATEHAAKILNALPGREAA